MHRAWQSTSYGEEKVEFTPEPAIFVFYASNFVFHACNICIFLPAIFVFCVKNIFISCQQYLYFMSSISVFCASNICVLCQQYLYPMPAIFVFCASKIVNVEDSCSDDTGSLIETTRPAMGCVWKKVCQAKSAIGHNKHMHSGRETSRKL